MSDNSAPILISELDLVPDEDTSVPSLKTDWRRRLAPYRRHLFVVAIVAGAALGAALFFATHDAEAPQEAYPVVPIEAR